MKKRVHKVGNTQIFPTKNFRKEKVHNAGNLEKTAILVTLETFF